MRALCTVAAPALILLSLAFGQEPHKAQKVGGAAAPPLEARVGRFDITDAIVRDGLSELSLKNIEGLHLGFEEVIRDRIKDDPRSLSTHFSLHLENRNVREILDALCESDPRYTWTEEGNSLNIYPRGVKGSPSYLLNLPIGRIALADVSDPDQALTPLSQLFPEQQVGYFGPGLGGNTYAEPWTVVFQRLTVRQFIDRIAEHMGPQTSWVWEGGRRERMFTFLKGGFHTQKDRQPKSLPAIMELRHRGTRESRQCFALPGGGWPSRTLARHGTR